MSVIRKKRKKKQTHRYREPSSGYQGEKGRHKQWDVKQAQGCIVPHEERSQYFVITVK